MWNYVKKPGFCVKIRSQALPEACKLVGKYVKMFCVWIPSSLETARTPTAVALGNFDGVHRGHELVVQPIAGKKQQQKIAMLSESEATIAVEDSQKRPLKLATRSRAESDKIYATVVTFNPHPQEFFTGKLRTLLTPLDEKVELLRSLGVEQLVLLPFNRELAELSPWQFVEKILVQQLRATRVSVGEDFCFGQGRTGTSADLQALAASYGIEVDIIPLQNCQGERISSSCIRQSLSEGDLQRANRLLGRPYTIAGKVVEGQKLGRTLGFPTANLQLPPEKFLPKAGVYCVRVWGSNLPLHPLNGVMNIGVRPTVHGTSTTVEVHLLDWCGDLYGQMLTVSLEKFLRSEEKFASLDALKAQIQQDASAARTFWEKIKIVGTADEGR